MTEAVAYEPLTLEEFVECLRVSVRRMRDSYASGLDHATTYERDYQTRLNEETTGAIGEYVVARRLGTAWGLLGTFHVSADAGPIEVRATVHDTGCLILRPREFKATGFGDRAFVLVVGGPSKIRIAGWIFGNEGVDDAYLRDARGFGKPAYFVPQSALRPFALLEQDEVVRVHTGLQPARLTSLAQGSFGWAP